MKYILSIRLLAFFSVLMVGLSVLTGVLVSADGLDPELLSGLNLPTPEEVLVLLAALDAGVFILLTCFLLSLISELLGNRLRLPLPRILLCQGRQLLFDNGSRAPPLSFL